MIFRILLFISAVAGTATSALDSYELRGVKVFSNEVDSHKCKQLFVNNKEVVWVFGATGTDVGPIVRICKEAAEPNHGGADHGTIHGGVLNGWYIVDLATGETVALSLPHLTNFSNPEFCGSLAAYWGMDGYSTYSLIVADLRSKKIVKSTPITKVALETDYMYHLAPAVWNRECDSASFSDPRYIEATVIDAKFN